MNASYQLAILIGMLSGLVGTSLGSVLAYVVNSDSKKILSLVLEFAAGIMFAIISFDLLPQGFELGGFKITIIGIIIGVVSMIILSEFVNKIERKTQNQMTHLGFLMAIGLGLHNFPEGLAIGAGLEASMKLGLNIALAIMLHDVPEGLSIALPLKKGGLSFAKVVGITTISGLPTVVGTLIGNALGAISYDFLALSLGFAGGAMLYVVCNELMPQAKSLYKGNLSIGANLIGFVCGIFVSSL